MAPQSSRTTSEPKVFTLYWRPRPHAKTAAVFCLRPPWPRFAVVACRPHLRSSKRSGVRPTGITFANTVPEDSAVNIVNYLYYYNGGGVAAGDIDGDGLIDLYFTSNLGSNRLYPQLGQFSVRGYHRAGGRRRLRRLEKRRHDGRRQRRRTGLDIYVSGVNYLAMNGRNVLYINNGDGNVHRPRR